MKKLKLMFILLFLFSMPSLFSQENEQLYLKKTVSGSFGDVTTKLKSLLKEQGFGVITEIDMDVKIKEKLKDVEMKPYKILGVCNPSFAHQTLQIEENIGVFLPCKALVKDLGEGKVEVVMLNPSALMGMLNKEELVKIGDQVTQKFKTALEKL